MNIKGKYILKYKVEKEEFQEIVEVKIEEIQGLLTPYQNIYQLERKTPTPLG